MAQRRRGSVKPARSVPDIDAKTGRQRIDEKTGRPKFKPAPGTTWFFAVDVGEGRERKQVRRRGFATKADAQEALTALLQAVVQREHVDYRGDLYGDWLVDTWLPLIRQEDIAISTWQRYAIDVRLHIAPHPIAKIPLQKLDGSHLDAHWALLRRKQSEKTGRVLSPRTVHLVSTTIGRSMRDATTWRHRIGNPCERSKMPTEGGRRERPSWDAGTVAAFLRWSRAFVPSSRAERTAGAERPSDGDRLYALWHLTATTGMRRGEVVGLDWERDMHLEGRCDCKPRHAGSHLVVGCAIRELSGQDLAELTDLDPVDVARGWMWAPPKTEAGYRTISLDRGTVAALTEWRTRQKAERLALGIGWRGEVGSDGEPRSLVFSRPDGSALMPSDVSETFRRRTERFGHALSIHGLRHTWATLALEAGVHPKVVQKRLGHTKIQTTLDLYSHVRPAIDAEAAQTVADLIADAPVPDAPKQRKSASVAEVRRLR